MDSVLKGVLEEELERNLQKQRVFSNELVKYPKGSLVVVKVHGDQYLYRKFRDGNKIVSIYVGPAKSVEAKKAYEEAKKYGAGNTAIGDIKNGAWTCVYGVDFGTDGASEIVAGIKSGADCKDAAVEIRIDSLEGEVIGYLPVEAGNGTEFTERVNALMNHVSF